MMESGRLSRHDYFPNLDGLRFFAFLSVLAGHLFYFSGYHNNSRLFGYIQYRFFSFGDLGVNFFFVLSGFLITWLLIREKTANRQIAFGNFYMRRILRIWPVYFLVVIAGFFIIPDIVPDSVASWFPVHISKGELIWYIAFVANFQIILHGMKSLILTVLWSISVEEQFYLLWPALTAFSGRKLFPVILVMLILASLIYRVTVWDSSLLFNYSTLSAVSALATGALSAHLALDSPAFLSGIKKLSPVILTTLYAAVFFLIPFRGYLTTLGSTFNEYYKPFEPLIFSILFALIILEQNYCENSLFKTGRWKLISRLGKYSYGAYAYHMIAMVLCIMLFSAMTNGNVPGLKGFIFICITTFCLTILMAFLSFELMERKVLRLKKYFYPADRN